MPFCRVITGLVVDEKDVPEVTEAFLKLIDSFLINHISVYENKVYSKPVAGVHNEEEVRSEIQSDTP